ncbi:MAG: hypothetical protein KUA35_01050 [Pseudodesulfovibrio sp.]|uniref:Uncharacterized protein n=1 Tax=Pseudodesulfovibrio aespoeensis (strain ATCC 700646 / DSM 10631 / Aspo-2) TaxID=643562 RepID=E6VV54_PSEA9|nr:MULTISPECIES: hypothetical protein [Pseudodesulfovibrio]MBU4191472.1 hypothetical protein [Pseudomonadota bacterium]ADU61205.1 hypothetical protein Daes_0178 [Pseudodesulfovibrio aespoeensis Aspo-2]MBU4245287.1 hypothetical protein [Pseudomonadota bacterium]MBU4379231.1 hypothetical protein [Pseudomonadota bacterium]MBU4476655.1 hypothetical protein [Pseudomonadota bacterium]
MTRSGQTPPDRILAGRDAGLAAFVAVTAAEALITGLARHSADAWTTGVLAVLVFSALAWLARQGRIIPLWAVVVIMLITGSRHLSVGLAGTFSTPGPALADLLRVAAGAVLAWGALAVFRSRSYRGDPGRGDSGQGDHG